MKTATWINKATCFHQGTSIPKINQTKVIHKDLIGNQKIYITKYIEVHTQTYFKFVIGNFCRLLPKICISKNIAVL